MQERNRISRHRAGVPLPDEQLLRDLQLTVSSSGAALAGAVHNPLSEVAGAARPPSVLERAGVQRLTWSDAQEGSIPRWRGDGGGWITEGQVLSAVALTLSSVNVSAHHCGAHIKYSRRLKSSTTGDEQAAVIAEMRRVVSATVEDGLINGTNTAGQPLGLLSQASGSVSFSAAAPTHAELLSMVEVIGDADGDLSRCSWLMHPSIAAVLMRTERATGSGFCIEPMSTQRWHCNGLPVLMSTHIPEAKVVLLDSNAASIVYFGPPQLLVDPYSNANSISGASTVVVSNYLDLGVTEPALVVVGST